MITDKFIKDTFVTPWGATLTAFYREGTNDWDTLTSCIVEDEYCIGRLPNNGLAIDLGAHIGASALPLLSKGYRVLCVEMLPENLKLLAANKTTNNFFPKAKIYPNAIAASQGKEALAYYFDTSNEHGAMHEFIGTIFSRKLHNPENIARDGRSIPVKTISLEQIFEENNIKKCDFMKVDIEGSEWEVFETISPNVLDRIDRIAVEIEGRENKPTSTDEFLSLLQDKFIDVSKEYFPKWCSPSRLVHGYFINKNLKI